MSKQNRKNCPKAPQRATAHPLAPTTGNLPDVLPHAQQVQLSQAKIYWLFGEWQRLVDLDENVIRPHPDRAGLALLVASANQQLVHHDQARHWVEQALAWGAEPHTVAQILISGVHNTMGRLAALREDAAQATHHFKEAINVAETVDVERIIHARFMKESEHLGLDDNVRRLISNALHDEPIIIKEEVYDTSGLIRKRHSDSSSLSIKKPKEKKLILVASMPRSGSTWLFNCVRLILEKKNRDFYSVWIDDYNRNSAAAIHLVKIHAPDPVLADEANVILSTRRDIREVAGSLKRMGWDKSGKEYFKQLHRIVDTVHDFWFRRTNIEIEYKEILNYPVYIIEKVGHAIGEYLTVEECVELAGILVKLQAGDEYDQKKTLLHPLHRAGISCDYSKILGEELLLEIEREFYYWIKSFYGNDRST